FEFDGGNIPARRQAKNAEILEEHDADVFRGPRSISAGAEGSRLARAPRNPRPCQLPPTACGEAKMSICSHRRMPPTPYAAGIQTLRSSPHVTPVPRTGPARRTDTRSGRSRHA